MLARADAVVGRNPNLYVFAKGQNLIAGAPRILGIDVARFGDDASVIFPRQGLVAFVAQKFRNIDGTEGAGAVAQMARLGR